MKTGFRVAEWLVDPLRGQIVGPGGPVRLEPRVMRVLVCPAENYGEIVSREKLIEQVWEGMFVADEVLTQSVSELRKAARNTKGLAIHPDHPQTGLPARRPRRGGADPGEVSERSFLGSLLARGFQDQPVRDGRAIRFWDGDGKRQRIELLDHAMSEVSP